MKKIVLSILWLRAWFKASLIVVIFLSLVFGVVYMCSKVISVPREEVSREYHKMYPLHRLDGDIKVKPTRGYISEGPVPLDENFAIVRVQVSTLPNADYASELGAIIALEEQPQVGDQVIMTTHEVYNNPLAHFTFVRVAKKIQEK